MIDRERVTDIKERLNKNIVSVEIKLQPEFNRESNTINQINSEEIKFKY